MALYGVNFGGWLIIEKWMTPSLFKGTNAVDEFTFMQAPEARQKLRQHQRSFIKEKDFIWLKKHNIGVIRLPVGYWVLDGDTPYISSVGKLDWAFSMANKYGLKILLDIHALPGSQNGQDHSGRVGKAEWQSAKENIEKGLQATLKIAKRYANEPSLWGVQIMNEPKIGIFQHSLRRYYNLVYKELLNILPAGMPVIYSDAFTPRLMTGAIWESPANPTYMDIHWYHFVAWRWLRPKWYAYLVKRRGRLLRRLKRHNGVIIGEWSGVYSQYIFDKYPQAIHGQMVKKHIERQLAAYEPATAWFYWSYKTECPGVWHFRSLVEDGTIQINR